MIVSPTAFQMAALTQKEAAMSRQDKRAYDRYFEATLNEHHPMLARLVSSYERKRELQEELYQEISLALWKSLAKFDRASSLKTYILSIAHKRAVSHVAKQVKQPYSQDIGELEIQGDNCPSDSVEQARRMQKLMAAIYKLPMTDRQLVTLALEGLSYKDISLILGISVSNVGAKLNRAKSKLNQYLSSEASR